AHRLHRGQRSLGRRRGRPRRAPAHAALPDRQDREADRPQPRRRARPAGAVAGAARARAAGTAGAGARAVSRVCVVSAAGIIGPAIVATLAREDAVSEIVCLDVDAERAAEVAVSRGGGKASAGALDIRDLAAARKALAGALVLVNTAAYRVNL